MLVRRCACVVAFLVATLLVAGCGDSTPTGTPPPASDKQKEKEKLVPGPGGVPKSK